MKTSQVEEKNKKADNFATIKQVDKMIKTNNKFMAVELSDNILKMLSKEAVEEYNRHIGALNEFFMDRMQILGDATEHIQEINEKRWLTQEDYNKLTTEKLEMIGKAFSKYMRTVYKNRKDSATC
jgi:hypothetical protein